ncbi:MAG: hypothetical protein ABIK12_10790 [Pseudomonadota bacterium]
MTGVEQIAIPAASAVAGGLVVHYVKRFLANAQKGRQAEEHAQFVTRDECERCKSGHLNDMTAGNDLFRLVLEGQSLHTQALVHLCNQDDGCRELRAKLQDYLARLATRQTRGR